MNDLQSNQYCKFTNSYRFEKRIANRFTQQNETNVLQHWILVVMKKKQLYN